MKHQTFSFQYQLYQGIYQIDGTVHVGYGITILNTADHSVHMTVEDIDVSKQNIAILIERCNRLQLSPEHLHDIVEDYLAYIEY